MNLKEPRFKKGTMVLSYDEIRRIVTYCAEEVRRQRDTHAHVAHMTSAWLDALEHLYHGDELSLGLVERWGMIVDPDDNPNGFRGADVWIGDHMGVRVPEIQNRMERWLENVVPNMTPLEAYREFELVHPFMDGNGRTGKIILNYLNGTMLDPIFPPSNFWGQRIQNP